MRFCITRNMCVRRRSPDGLTGKAQQESRRAGRGGLPAGVGLSGGRRTGRSAAGSESAHRAARAAHSVPLFAPFFLRQVPGQFAARRRVPTGKFPIFRGRGRNFGSTPRIGAFRAQPQGLLHVGWSQIGRALLTGESKRSDKQKRQQGGNLGQKEAQQQSDSKLRQMGEHSRRTQENKDKSDGD